MSENEVIEYVKNFCEQNGGIEYVSHIHFANNCVAVLVKGEDCINKLNECLDNLGLEYSKTTELAGEFGSYISLN